MKELIDKSAVIAEIDAIQDDTMDENRNFLSSYHEGIFDGLSKIENFLDTLEGKEVDVEKELKLLDNTLFDLDGVAVQGATHYLTVEDVKDIAKHFYELGLKEQKGE